MFCRHDGHSHQLSRGSQRRAEKEIPAQGICVNQVEGVCVCMCVCVFSYTSRLTNSSVICSHTYITLWKFLHLYQYMLHVCIIYTYMCIHTLIHVCMYVCVLFHDHRYRPYFYHDFIFFQFFSNCNQKHF